MRRQTIEECFMYLPHNHFMTPLKAQALHSEHHPLQHTWQGVGEGNLGCHLFTNHSVSQRLPEESQ